MGAGSGWHRVASPVTSPRHSWGLLVGLSPRGAQPLSGGRGAQCQTRVGFGYRNTFGGFGCTKSAQAQPPSLPGPVGRPATVSPSGRGRRPPGCASLQGGDAQGSLRASRGLAGTRAGGRLGSPSVTSAPGRHPPQPRRAVPAWPAPKALRRPPRPGASQVLERSWERIPWPRCGSALTRRGTRRPAPLPRIDFSVNSLLL